MLHKFKFASRRYAYDSVSGTVHSLEELGYKMLDYLVIPMAPDCPSALRYDLAKYDSEAISATYDVMLAEWKAGRLFSEDEPYDTVKPSAVVAGAKLVETPAGLKIEPSDELLDDLDEELADLDRAIKAALKSGSGSIFAPVEVSTKCYGCCKNCFARKLCSLDNPGEQLCELERKRVECELAVKTEG